MNVIELIQLFSTVVIVGAAWNLSGRLSRLETHVDWIKKKMEGE